MDGSSNVCRNGRNCGSEGCNKVSSLWSVFVSALIYLPYVVVLQGALVCVYLLLMFFFGAVVLLMLLPPSLLVFAVLSSLTDWLAD